MLRFSFTALSALSLALCAASAFMWVRSYRQTDHVVIPWMGGISNDVYLQQVYHIATSSRGGIEWATQTAETGSQLPPFSWLSLPDDGTPRRFVLLPEVRAANRRFGISYQTWHMERCSPELPRCLGFVDIQYWLPTSTSAVLPMAWLITHRRRTRRRVTGKCVECGYDLRATPERCPECGSLSGKAKRSAEPNLRVAK